MMDSDLPPLFRRQGRRRRRRASKACLECRKRRVRCDVTRTASPCTTCRTYESICTVVPRANALSKQPPETRSRTVDEFRLLELAKSPTESEAESLEPESVSPAGSNLSGWVENDRSLYFLYFAQELDLESDDRKQTSLVMPQDLDGSLVLVREYINAVDNSLCCAEPGGPGKEDGVGWVENDQSLFFGRQLGLV
ncbi:hypothetical protein GE09DRAFT_1146887 [Coniochaeta sp. 2T2.1]|nr:hypothetical protein GE09DRAFT_1146887 [Coniochaeta sp. 2T2.1]